MYGDGGLGRDSVWVCMPLLKYGRCDINGVLRKYIDGLVQNGNISSTLAMEILRSGTKPSIYGKVWLLTYIPGTCT